MINLRRFPQASILLLLTLVASKTPAQVPPLKAPKLTSQPLERELSAVTAHSYELRIAAGQFLTVIVEQQGVDVSVQLLTRNGDKIAEVDSPNGSRGPELLAAVIDKKGDYQIQITPVDPKPAGRYRIRISELRPATDADRTLTKNIAEARAIFGSAEALVVKRDENSLKEAAAKADAALQLWRLVADRYWEARTLNLRGVVDYRLGQKQTALEFFTQAAQLSSEFEDRSVAAGALVNAAQVYSDLGDREKTIASYKQALPRLREDGNGLGEAAAYYEIAQQYDRLGNKAGALDFYEQAAGKYRDLGEQGREANTLRRLGLLHSSLGRPQRALELFNQALALQKAKNDRSGQALTLKNIGDIYSSLDQPLKAVAAYNEAIPLFEPGNYKATQASTLSSAANAYGALGNSQKAIEFHSKALPLIRELGNQTEEALTLASIAVAQASLREHEKALANANQAVAVARNAKDKAVEAAVLSFRGLVYNVQGEKQKALEDYEQALALQHEVGERSVQALTLNAMAAIYHSRGDKQKALELLNEARSNFNAAGNKIFEAMTLRNVAAVYYWLGDSQNALQVLERASAIYSGIGDRAGASNVLSSTGFVYEQVGDYTKARQSFELSIQLARSANDRLDEGYGLLGLGAVNNSLNKPDEALPVLNKALAIFRTSGFAALRYAEAYTLACIGKAHELRQDRENALRFYNQALLLAREAEDKDVEGFALPQLMTLWRALNQPESAIFYGKKAVNLYQQVRSNIRRMDEGLQKSFLSSKQDTYRELADVLISQGRLAEAQQVLGLLKEKEYFDFVRRDATEALSAVRLNYTPEEAELEKRFAELSDRIAAIGAERSALLALSTRTADQEKRLAILETQIQIANEAFQKFLTHLATEFPKTSAASRVGDIREAQAMKAVLRELDAVAVLTIAGDDRYHAILITPDIEKAYEFKIKRADLNRKIFAFREALENPKSAPLALAQDLYTVLIGRELARDIAQTKKRTIVWSLDGSLRYVPVAALHDGRKFLVESYRNVMITLAHRDHLKDPISRNWQALGLGVSRTQIVQTSPSTQLKFQPLPAVREELSAIVRDGVTKSGTTGILPGKVMLDEDFTLNAMKSALRLRANEQPFKLVHIASHFNFVPGDETKSFLLLGDGNVLKISDFKNLPDVFSRVELLTLSACNTASGGSGEGAEVESFAVWAQRQGAEAIIASLWPVQDTSTGQLMREFYSLRGMRGTISKAEALRQAQLSLLRGPANASGLPRPRTSATPNREGDSFSHPYFWAPFILIGNWR